jgi:GTP-binding protein
MNTKIPTVAIIGRTNVGKSSLFNAIVGRTVSIVEDAPGVTRDRNYAYVTRFGFPFTLIDTGGLVGEEEENKLHSSVREQCEIAIAEADLILCVFDAKQGVHPLDHEVVDYLRRTKKPVIWVANKTEQPTAQALAGELYSLGLEEVELISAAHKNGVKELVEVVRVKLGAEIDPSLAGVSEYKAPREEGVIRVALVGKPNVGKSSILNRIIGEDRVVTSNLPGTTTDSVDVTLTRDGQKYRFVDTAGLRKKAKVAQETVEHFSNVRTLRALAKCDVAVLVLDATEGGVSEQDTKIAGLVHERGRGLIVVVNKWDAIEKDHRTVHEFTEIVQAGLKFAQYAPIIFVSALSGRRCPSILEMAKEVYEGTNLRIQTSDLNRLLNRAVSNKPPPVYHGEPIKLYFSTQIGSAPPTFVLFVNHPKKINFSYERYLKNCIRDQYPLPGLDIKIIFKKRTSKEDRRTEDFHDESTSS